MAKIPWNLKQLEAISPDIIYYSKQNIKYTSPQDIYERLMRKLVNTRVYRPWHDYRIEVEDCPSGGASILRFIQRGDGDNERSMRWAIDWNLTGKEVDQKIDLAIDKFAEFLHAQITHPEIDHVIFNPPATIAFWKDGTKTIVKKQKGDRYSKEAGLAFCYMKKVLGNKGNFNNQFRKWCGEKN